MAVEIEIVVRVFYPYAEYGPTENLIRLEKWVNGYLLSGHTLVSAVSIENNSVLHYFSREKHGV